MGRTTLLALIAVSFLAGGCPKRQTPPRLVYVTSQAAATSAASQPSTEAMVIEEPPPPAPRPEPVQVLPTPELAMPRPVVRQRPRSRTDSPGPEESSEAPPSAEVPPLKPRASSEQQDKLQGEIRGLQSDTRQRIARLEQRGLSAADRKTLEDAEHFLADSERALADGDFQRSQNLAHKAVLLVDATEKNY